MFSHISLVLLVSSFLLVKGINAEDDDGILQDLQEERGHPNLLSSLLRLGALENNELDTMSVWARKMGAKHKKPTSPPVITPANIDTEEILELDEKIDEDNGDNDYEEEEEEKCPRKQFWHIGGRRCVPYRCPSDAKRDPTTGECVGLPRSYWGYWGGRYGPYRSSIRMNQYKARPSGMVARFKG